MSELVALPKSEKPISHGDKERHRIYSLLVAALVHGYWNGNKRRNEGVYPWREKQRLPNGLYEGGDYLGHNIGCLAVDAIGEVIDFDFNHNEIFNSSVEHAESRLIRRIFSLTQIYDNWETRLPSDPPRRDSYSTILSGVTVYTSLESCSQCAGIMALGKVKEVVYLHRDPGMYMIGNILRKLTLGSELQAPLPIAANEFDFEYFDLLNDAYQSFSSEVANVPFHIGAKVDHGASITSFLCTDKALEIYEKAAQEFAAYKVQYGNYKPEGSSANTLNNAACYEHALRFYRYALNSGRRGSPHKM